MPPDLNGTSHNIRIATSHDLAAMISLVNAAFSIEKFLEGPRTDETRMGEMMKKGQMLLAENGAGEVVGAVYVELRGERGYFGMLAVDPSRQGTGLGRLMVEAAEHHARRHGCTLMDISVLSLRPELLPFYRKLGYTESGTEEFRPSRPLKPGVQCYCFVMSKPL